jgi:dipeptidase E
LQVGETRDERLEQFLEENDSTLVALPEGAWLGLDGDRSKVGGRNGAKIFNRSSLPEELPAAGDLPQVL